MATNHNAVLITGGSSGIGMEAAVDLAARGYRVIATMRNTAKQGRLVEAAAKRGVALDVQALDVVDAGSIAACAHHVGEKYGPLHALVNNAGYGMGGFFEDLTDREYRDQMETNFWGVLNVTRAFLPPMRQAGRGYIVMVSSESGRVAIPGLGAYQSSKFALEGFSEGLWHELKPFGVHVVLVEPGMIATDIFTANIKLCEAGLNPKSHYYTRSQKILDKTMKDVARRAAPPDACNATIAAVLEDPAPGLRYLVGSDAKLVTLLKWILPERLFLKLVASEY